MKTIRLKPLLPFVLALSAFAADSKTPPEPSKPAAPTAAELLIQITLLKQQLIETQARLGAISQMYQDAYQHFENCSVTLAKAQAPKQ